MKDGSRSRVMNRPWMPPKTRQNASPAMIAKGPKIARAAHRRAARMDRGQFVFLLEAAAVQQKVDLAHLEATDFELNLRCKF